MTLLAYQRKVSRAVGYLAKSLGISYEMAERRYARMSRQKRIKIDNFLHTFTLRKAKRKV